MKPEELVLLEELERLVQLDSLDPLVEEEIQEQLV